MQQKKLLDTIVTSLKLSSCGRQTLLKCVEKNLPCSGALRLYNFACWLSFKKTPVRKSILALKKREYSLHSMKKFHITPSKIKKTGTPLSPIMLTIYISSSCPLCKKVTIPLYSAVTEGPLKNIAQLQVKPISIRPGDVAYLAIDSLAHFWPYFIHTAQIKRRLNDSIIFTNAFKMGIDTTLLRPMLKSKSYLNMIIQNKKEAKQNGVVRTPTIFIDDKKYQSYKNPQWIIDAVEFIYYCKTK